MADKFDSFQTAILNNLHNSRKRLVGVSEQKRELFQVLESSKRGTHTSILLIGSKGSGKTSVLREALDDLDKTYPSTKLIRIVLNGAVQTDDVTSMYEIVRQMCKAIADETPAGGMKSQPKAPRFCENFDLLCEMLRERMQKTRPVVFILDRFELFAMRTKQTLLYNLFDLLQANAGALAIVGMTARKDVFDLLEKRVKSRFSHQKIHFYPPTTIAQIKEFVQMSLHMSVDKADSNCVERHNRAVNKLLSKEKVIKSLERCIAMSRSWGWYIQLLEYAVGSLSQSFSKSKRMTTINEKDFEQAFSKFQRNYMVETCCNMSVMELTLIISLIKLEMKEIVPYNFHIIHEYIRRAEKRADLGLSLHVDNRRTVLSALKNFVDLGLLLPVTHSGKVEVKDSNKNKTLTEFQMYRLTVDPGCLSRKVNKLSCLGAQLKNYLFANI